MKATRKKIYIIVTIFLILILVLFFGLVSPLFSSVKKDSSELISQKGELVFLGEKRENFKNLQENYLNIKPILEKLAAFSVDSKEPIDFINFLEKTAEKLKLTIQISLVSKESDKKSCPGIYFQVKTTGNFSDFMKFLEKLESASYLIEIENLSLRKVSETEANFGLKKGQSVSLINSNLDIKVCTK